MAFSESKGINIIGITSVFPKNSEDNLSLSTLEFPQRESLVKHTGIRHRHRLLYKKASVKDAFKYATEKLMENCQWSSSSIDLLIVVSQTTLGQIPSVACQLHGDLQLKPKVIAYDINLGCSGYIYGLHTASQLLQSLTKDKSRAILCCGDFSSQLTDDADMAVRPIFSDAVTATAIEFDRNKSNPIYFNLETFGVGKDAIYTEEMEQRYLMRLNGIDVYNYSLKYVPNNVRQLVENYKMAFDEIDYYVFHQANKLINDSIVKKLNLSSGKVPSTLHDFGNTSSASIPITLSQTLLKQNKQKFNLILSGFGVGFSVASVCIKVESLQLFEPYFIDI